MIPGFKTKLSDYAQLIKLRLTLMVVFSASMAYLWATNRNVDAATIWLLSVGGFLITASSNIFNQVIEKDSDRLMKRTAERPLPALRMSFMEALLLGISTGIAGLVILFQINLISALLGLLAMIVYACMYTPLKKISRSTIFFGAIAGSLPVVIGCTAANGYIGKEALLLFAVQFAWQFPHTWSIAWLLNDDYTKAGLKMLPSRKGKNEFSAMMMLVSTFLMVPAGLLLYMYESAGISVAWLLAVPGLVMAVFAIRHYILRTDRSAVHLMLSSLTYLPLVLLILVMEKYL